MPESKKKSEVWFEAYAGERRLKGGDDHEPDLGVASRPDYRIRGSGAAAICEVKEFTTSSLERRLKGVRYASLSGHDQYGTVRNKITKAAKKQLRPCADRGEALIVVLANPNSITVPIYQPDDVLAAMYGDQGFLFDVDLITGQGGDGEFAFLEDGVFGGGRHRYISGVVTLHRRALADDAKDRWIAEHCPRASGGETPSERRAIMVETLETLNAGTGFEEAANTPGHYFYARTYETTAAATGEAVPIPRDLFAGPHDEFRALNGSTGSLELLRR